MATVTTRVGKGSPLTNTEIDNNFINLNTDQHDHAVSVTAHGVSGTLVGTTDVQTLTNKTISGAFNGTIGATTPAPGSFTTLSATDNVTLTGAGSGFRVVNPDNGYANLSSSILAAGGLRITQGAMSTSAKYVAPIVFGSTDADFTTTNPKWGAAITAYALEAFTADTAGGMGLEFFASPTAPGAAQPTLTSLGTWTTTGLAVTGNHTVSGNTTLGDASTDTVTVSGIIGTGTTPTARNNTSIQTKDGIGFPATQVPSADANTLDDYEEGVFTPGITFGGSATGITTSASSGNYTKIGRVVYIAGVLTLTSKGGLSGAAVINGLPFTVGNNLTGTSMNGIIGSLCTVGGTALADFSLSPNAPSSTLIPFNYTGGTATQVVAADVSDSFSIRFSGHYTV